MASRDQLAAQTLVAEELEREQAALDAARRELEISNNRYKAGVEQYLDVITAQTTVLTHEQNVVRLRGQYLAAGVSLVKAMGGDWSSKSSHGDS